jgi:uncharacterized SAM-binding protein YcdF (DUF218 family)
MPFRLFQFISITAKSIIASCRRVVKPRYAVIAIGIVVFGVAVTLTMLYQQVDARASIDKARRADVIIVLGAAVYPGERPSPTLNARIQHAIDLYRAGFAPRLILSGGLGKNPPTEAEAMRRVMVNAGIPNAALLLEDQSHSTEENLGFSKRIMDAHGWHSAIIASDPFHLYRAETIARDLGIEAYGSPALLSPTWTVERLRWWNTGRESIALGWYYVTRVTGEPTWLYGWLKGKI